MATHDASSSPSPSAQATEEIAAGKWLALKRRGPWEFATRIRGRAAAVIVSLTPDGELVLIEQYRPALGRRCVELPAGLVGDTDDAPDEGVAIAAGRELTEETGYEAAGLEVVAHGPASAGLSDETLYVVLGRSLTKVGPGGGDEHEDIEVHLVPLGEVPDFVAAKSQEGVAVDLKIWAGLYWANSLAAER